MEKEDKAYSEKAKSYEKHVKQTIEDFANSLIDFANPTLLIKGAEEKMDIAEKELERIIKKDNLTEEEKYFIHKEINLNEIFSEYHKDALRMVGNFLGLFYMLSNSECSRNLDTVVWFAKYLKVPVVKYVDKILENTPKEYRQKELEDEIKFEKVSEEDLRFLLNKYRLEPPKRLLPITEDYKEEVHLKKGLLDLLEKLDLK